MKRAIAAIVAIGTATAAACQEPADDPFITGGASIPTVAEASALRERAMAAVTTGDCGSAAPLLAEYAESVNRLSNMIRQGVEPFYSADRESRERYRGANSMRELSAAESASNIYVAERNRAMVDRAKCLMAIGEDGEATNVLFAALSRITVNEPELWAEARSILWGLAGYSPPAGAIPVAPSTKP